MKGSLLVLQSAIRASRILVRGKMNPSTFRSAMKRVMVATSSVSSSAVATVSVQLSSDAPRLMPSRKSVRNGL